MSKYHIVGNHMSRLIYIHPQDPQLDSAVVVIVGGGTAVEYVNVVPVVITCGVVVVSVSVVVSVVVVAAPAVVVVSVDVVVVPTAVVVESVVVVEAPGTK